MLKCQICGLALNRRKWPEMGPEWSPGLESDHFHTSGTSPAAQNRQGIAQTPDQPPPAAAMLSYNAVGWASGFFWILLEQILRYSGPILDQEYAMATNLQVDLKLHMQRMSGETNRINRYISPGLRR